MNCTNPIGFFDSGWGGLSILRAARKTLSHEDFVYVADCAHAPYGDRDHDYIVKRASTIARFLFDEQGIKALVVACNTATVETIEVLRALWPDRIILGVEPAIKPAIVKSHNKKVGMIATTRTVTSTRYQSLLKSFAQNAHVYSTGCPGLMECVERGELNTAQTRSLLHTYLDPMKKKGVDSLVLGCTHYPFLEEPIASIMGPEVSLYEPGPAVARYLKERLNEKALLNTQGRALNTFFVSGLNPERKNVAQALYPLTTSFEELPL